ncbi:MAG: cytoplasmic protein [Chthoniobacteraceae bacterium]
MSARQFGEFRASSLYCARCGVAQSVSERLLLVLPDRELHEYRCTVCGDSVGTKEVTAADKVAQRLATRRGGRQVRIL